MSEDNDRFETWSEEFETTQANPPKDGDILYPDEGKAILVVELTEGKPPFIYGRVFVPEIVGAKLGWFLQSSETQGFHGWKCILMPRARTELIRRYGISEEVIEVKSLKVVRLSQSGKSLLCEVHEYCEPEPETETVDQEPEQEPSDSE